MVLPSSFTRPLPAATTLACCGFSLAVSGMMMPPTRCSCSSTRFTSTRSRRGRTFMDILLSGARGPTLFIHAFYPLTLNLMACQAHDLRVLDSYIEQEQAGLAKVTTRIHRESRQGFAQWARSHQRSRRRLPAGTLV